MWLWVWMTLDFCIGLRGRIDLPPNWGVVGRIWDVFGESIVSPGLLCEAMSLIAAESVRTRRMK